MSNPAPVLVLPGTIRSVAERDVPALDAAEAVRDESGRITREAREAREAYSALDFVVLTDDGGFANVVMRADGLTHWDGAIPERGAVVSLPVRPFVQWEGRPGRKYPVIRYAVYTDGLAGQAKPAKPAGTRHLAPTGS